MYRVVWHQAQVDPAAEGLSSPSLGPVLASFILRPAFPQEVAKWLLKACSSETLVEIKLLSPQELEPKAQEWTLPEQTRVIIPPKASPVARGIEYSGCTGLSLLPQDAGEETPKSWG